MALFTPKALTASINTIPTTEPSIVLDKVFKNRKTEITDTLDIEVTDGTTKLSVPVSDVEGGRVVSGTTKKVMTIVAPRYRDKILIPAKELLLTPGAQIHIDEAIRRERQMAKVANEQRNLKNLSVRTREYNAAQLIGTGEVTITSDTVNIHIVYPIPATNKVTLTGTSLFSDPAADIAATFRKGRALVAKAGSTVVAMCDRLTADAILGNEKLKKTFDYANVVAGNLTYTEPYYIGTISGVPCYVCDETATDSTGATIDLFPTKTLSFCAVEAFQESFGLVIDGENDGRPTEYFSKMYEEKDPSGEWLLSETRGTPLIKDVRGLAIFKTLA